MGSWKNSSLELTPGVAGGECDEGWGHDGGRFADGMLVFDVSTGDLGGGPM